MANLQRGEVELRPICLRNYLGWVNRWREMINPCAEWKKKLKLNPRSLSFGPRGDRIACLADMLSLELQENKPMPVDPLYFRAKMTRALGWVDPDELAEAWEIVSLDPDCVPVIEA